MFIGTVHQSPRWLEGHFRVILRIVYTTVDLSGASELGPQASVSPHKVASWYSFFPQQASASTSWYGTVALCLERHRSIKSGSRSAVYVCRARFRVTVLGYKTKSQQSQSTAADEHITHAVSSSDLGSRRFLNAQKRRRMYFLCGTTGHPSTDVWLQSPSHAYDPCRTCTWFRSRPSCEAWSS